MKHVQKHIKVDLVTNVTFMLYKYLRQNSSAGLPFIVDGMANIEVFDEWKAYLAAG
jgi:hypothetical protein